MTQPRSEWLKPIDERFLVDEGAPPPLAVKVAVVLSAINALAAAAAAVIYVPLTIDMAGDPVITFTLIVSATAAVAAVALAFVFGAGVVNIVRRGWSRIITYAGLLLGLLALLALNAASLADEVTHDDSAVFLLPRIAVTAAAAFGIVLLLRVRSAAHWLAVRRHRTRTVAKR